MTKRLTRKDFDLVKFPNGEFKLVLHPTLTGEIQWKFGGEFANGKFQLTPSEELVALFQLDKIAEKHGHGVKQKVYADYLPFKRQDKDKLLGEIIFNSIYEKIEFIELHEVAPHDSDTFARYALGLYEAETYLYENVVFPDCGAQERFKNFETKIWKTDKKDIIQFITTFDKKRNADTGKLEFTEFSGDSLVGLNNKEGTKAVIIDDICSYGGTFKHVASELKRVGVKYVKLVVNHIDEDKNGKHLYNAKEMEEAGIDEIVVLNGGFE